MNIPAIIDRALVSKYNVNGPRYTSYPTALQFEHFEDCDLLDENGSLAGNDFSIYIHIPFCHQLCYYCGCNKIVTRHQERADRYLDYLEKEIIRRADIASQSEVRQIHLGGGSPSFLTIAQHTRLMAMLHHYFTVAASAQISIELDPRHIDGSYLAWLAQLGYNRISLGVQDIDEQVQNAINRVQDTAHIAELVRRAQQLGIASVNLDLIYGLPHQSVETFTTTLTAVKAMAPDRISLFSYAHLPKRFAAQRKIHDDWLPAPEQKLTLMELAISRLTGAGYEMIGMDHFALRDDELSIAKRDGKLHRNFQGYTSCGDLYMLGLGVSAISDTGEIYSQNPKRLNDYYEKIDSGKGLTQVGYRLTEDDTARRFVIQSLMCNLIVTFDAIQKYTRTCPRQYFNAELTALKPFIEDGLVSVTGQAIVVHETARLLIRTICSTFDAYLPAQGAAQRYSRVI